MPKSYCSQKKLLGDYWQAHCLQNLEDLCKDCNGSKNLELLQIDSENVTKVLLNRLAKLLNLELLEL